MANWFDENDYLKPESEKKEEHIEGEKDAVEEVSQSPAESSAPSADSESPKSGQESAVSETQQYNPPPVSPPETPWYSPQGSSYQTQQNNSTYHYGVNTPNQVPNSTNYYQPYGNQGGGYNQQGGYNPYGNWQRMPQPDMQPNNQPGMPPKPPKKKKRGVSIAIAALSVICAGAIITLSVLLAIALSDNSIKNTGNPSSGDTSTTINKNAPALSIEEDDPDAKGLSTAAIVEKNLASTVVITIYDRTSSFYGVPQQQEVGTASGIVMSADGYIITNWHVVINENTAPAYKPYERIDVKTYDGTVYENAEVVGADKDTDLAVIKVGAIKLSVPDFGDSSALKLGDKVVAIGNAGGLSWTTTQGIVSGLARDVYEDTGYAIKCLQVDAAINPGNSGGPLINSQGQVVGVNSAKIVAPGYEGLGFSIPIKEAKVIIDDLVKYGYVKNRVVLGVTVRDITQPGYEGVQILEINKNSCLVGTNARVGDIITRLNNTDIRSGVDLRSELSKFKVGDKCTLTLIRVDRDGGKETIKVTCTLKEYQG